MTLVKYLLLSPANQIGQIVLWDSDSRLGVQCTFVAAEAKQESEKEWHFIWMTCHQEKGFLVGGGIPELVISLRQPCNPSHPPPSPLSGICIFAALPILWPLLQIRLLSSVHDVTPGPALETLFCCGHDVAQFSWGPNLSKFLKQHQLCLQRSFPCGGAPDHESECVILPCCCVLCITSPQHFSTPKRADFHHHPTPHPKKTLKYFRLSLWAPSPWVRVHVTPPCDNMNCHQHFILPTLGLNLLMLQLFPVLTLVLTHSVSY